VSSNVKILTIHPNSNFGQSSVVDEMVVGSIPTLY
jgi:hypothetical protein